jgi:hypothetical protein
MPEHRLEPGRLASFLFQSQPDEAYEIALDFLNDSLGTQDREGAVTWTAVLTMIEKLHSDSDNEPALIRETRASSMM